MQTKAFTFTQPTLNGNLTHKLRMLQTIKRWWKENWINAKRPPDDNKKVILERAGREPSLYSDKDGAVTLTDPFPTYFNVLLAIIHPFSHNLLMFPIRTAFQLSIRFNRPVQLALLELNITLVVCFSFHSPSSWFSPLPCRSSPTTSPLSPHSVTPTIFTFLLPAFCVSVF